MAHAGKGRPYTAARAADQPRPAGRMIRLEAGDWRPEVERPLFLRPPVSSLQPDRSIFRKAPLQAGLHPVDDAAHRPLRAAKPLGHLFVGVILQLPVDD